MSPGACALSSNLRWTASPFPGRRRPHAGIAPCNLPKTDPVAGTRHPATDSENDERGPVDDLVLEFPAGPPPDGSALPLLRDLVDRRIVRVLDPAFVRKDPDGSAAGLDNADVGLEGEVDVTLRTARGIRLCRSFEHAGECVMPGLLRGVARTAAVAGTATAVSHRVSPPTTSPEERDGPDRRDEGPRRAEGAGCAHRALPP